MTKNRSFAKLACLYPWALLLAACAPEPQAPLSMAEMPPLQADSPAAVGLSERELWLTPPHVYGEAVWFPDELEPLGDAVAELLAEPTYGGYQVRLNAELRLLWRSVQLGRLPGVSQACDAQPPPAELAKVLYRGASKGEVRVDCEAVSCELLVIVSAPRPKPKEPLNYEETARFGAELPAAESPDQWAARLRDGLLQRVPPPEHPPGGLGLGGLATPGQPPGIYATVHAVSQVGPWDHKLKSAEFQPLAKQLHACSQTKRPWRDWWGQPYVIEVTPSGQLSRCEFPYRERLPPPDFSCGCQVLRGMSFGAAEGVRRARFYLDTFVYKTAGPKAERAPLYRSAYLADQVSSDPTAVLGSGEVARSDLLPCLASISQPIGEVKIPVHFSVGADGRVAQHQSTWPAVVNTAARACLDAILAKARFNCPLSGRARISAQLDIAVKPYTKATR